MLRRVNLYKRTAHGHNDKIDRRAIRILFSRKSSIRSVQAIQLRGCMCLQQKKRLQRLKRYFDLYSILPSQKWHLWMVRYSASEFQPRRRQPFENYQSFILAQLRMDEVFTGCSSLVAFIPLPIILSRWLFHHCRSIHLEMAQQRSRSYLRVLSTRMASRSAHLHQ